MHLSYYVILSNLREAQEQLVDLIDSLSTDPDNADSYLEAYITHTYDHINTAWNARYVSVEKYRTASEEDIDRWRKFPTDIDLT